MPLSVERRQMLTKAEKHIQNNLLTHEKYKNNAKISIIGYMTVLFVLDFLISFDSTDFFREVSLHLGFY